MNPVINQLNNCFTDLLSLSSKIILDHQFNSLVMRSKICKAKWRLLFESIKIISSIVQSSVPISKYEFEINKLFLSTWKQVWKQIWVNPILCFINKNK